MSVEGDLRTDSRAFAGVVLALFFVSGFTGLVYQVFWFKKLALLFGNTSSAAAVILATFFLGMAVGNAVWGRQSVKARFPLRTYAFLEAGVALDAYLYFFLLDTYYSIYPLLFQLSGNHSALFIAVKLVLAMAILFPAAFFMGGTLPVISQYWVRDPDSLGRTVPLLYAVNTLGAALGAYAAGFHLPLLFGFRNSYILNILITSIVAFTAWSIGKYKPFLALPVRQNKSIHSKSQSYIKHFPARVIWILAFLSGFVALSLEVLWTRMFALVLQNSVYSFSMILTVFIISLAFGSALASFLASRNFLSHNILFVLLSTSGLLIGTSPFIFTWITGGLEYQGRELDALALFKSVSLVIFLPGLFLGSVFPYLMKISGSIAGNAGEIVGKITAFNLVGAILGSLFTGIFFLKRGLKPNGTESCAKHLCC